MAAPAQSRSASPFEPLNGWKAAVLAGDKAALAALYTSDPPAQAQTPAGKSEDPGEEPAFWSAIAAKGILTFEPKILQVTKPQPGVTILALRVELTPRTDVAPQPEIVSAAQVWVQQADHWRIYMTQRSDVIPAPQSRLPEPEVPNTDLYPPPEEAKADIDAALAAAAKDHKRVILVFGGNWCFDCHVLDEAFHSKELAPLVDANYIVVHVDIGDGQSNLDLAKKYGIGLDKGVPSLGIVAPDGSVVFGQNNGEFENSARIGPEDLAAFLEEWKPSKNN
jgi:thioredoxin 1